MKQREIIDKEGTTWTCVQAFSGPGSEGMEKAVEKLTADDNHVPVVCTPSGGAQSTRLQLPRNWIKELSDEKLLQELSRQS